MLSTKQVVKRVEPKTGWDFLSFSIPGKVLVTLVEWDTILKYLKKENIEYIKLNANRMSQRNIQQHILNVYYLLQVSPY